MDAPQPEDLRAASPSRGASSRGGASSSGRASSRKGASSSSRNARFENFRFPPIIEEDKALKEALLRARKLGARFSFDKNDGRLVRFTWRGSSILPLIENQGDCDDCWARSVCCVLYAMLRIMRGKAPEEIKSWCIDFLPEELLNGIRNDISSQELMEGLKDICLDEINGKKFMSELEACNEDVKTLIMLLGESMPPSHVVKVEDPSFELIPHDDDDDDDDVDDDDDDDDDEDDDDEEEEGEVNLNSCYSYYSTLAWEWIKKNGIRFDSDYPYQDSNGSHWIGDFKAREDGCRYIKILNWNGLAFTDGQDREIEENLMLEKEELLMRESVEHPFCGSFTTDPSFYKVRKGVYEPKKIAIKNKEEGLENLIPHEMMGIGFDITNPLDKHWIAQNSYGSSWGDGGIGKVRFNSLISGDDKKVCRILPLTRACWPLFEPPSSKKRARLPTISTKVADNPGKRQCISKEPVRRSDRIKDKEAQKASVKPSTVQERRGQSVMDAAGPLTLADTSSKIKKGRKREATPLLPTAPAILDYATDAVRKKRTRQSHEGLKFAFTSKDLHDEYAIEKHNKTAKENAELALQDFDTVNERNVKEDGSESVGSKSDSIGIASDRSFGSAREDDCGSCDKGNHRVESSVALKSDSPGLS